MTDVERTVARAELLKRALIVLTALLVAAVLAVSLFTLQAIRETQQEGSPAVKRIETLSEQIRSCTSPSGACYRRGVKTQQDAVQTLTRSQEAIAVVAAACADQPGTQTADEIRSCVTKILAPIPAP